MESNLHHKKYAKLVKTFDTPPISYINLMNLPKEDAVKQKP